MASLNGRYVLAEFPQHTVIKSRQYEWDGYDWGWYRCAVCDELLVEHTGDGSWTGVTEPSDAPCRIIGIYKDGVLERVDADRDWLRDHADELHLFPPLRAHVEEETNDRSTD